MHVFFSGDRDSHRARAGAGAADLQQPDRQGQAGGAGAALQVPRDYQGDHEAGRGAGLLHRVRHQPPGQGGAQHAQLQVSVSKSESHITLFHFIHAFSIYFVSAFVYC